MLSATSPFTFSEIGESAIFRFLKLIDCDNGKIGSYTKLVKDRKASAHPNGIIHYADQQTLDLKITETLRVVAEIQKHSKCVIEDCYRQFLLDSHQPGEREYPDAIDQIREVLIHQNYLSQKDIEICLAYNVAPLSSDTNFLAIEALHQSLRDTYSDAEPQPSLQKELVVKKRRGRSCYRTSSCAVSLSRSRGRETLGPTSEPRGEPLSEMAATASWRRVLFDGTFA
ncbi:MAG: hypothetical protein ABI945_10610 [Nitrospirales bacterium]